MIFIMIAGASGSGKTVFSQLLLDRLRGHSLSCQLINLDNYYKERDVLKYPDIDLFRQEPHAYLPTQLDLEQISNDLISLAQGQSIYQKEFVFGTNLYKRDPQGALVLEKIDPSDIVIMEGLFAQYIAKHYLPSIYPRITVNVATSSYINIIKTRLQRDTAPPPLGRQITPQQVIENEYDFVGPVFFQYTARHATGSDIYVLNDHGDEGFNTVPFEEGFQEIMAQIHAIKQALYLPKTTPRDALDMVKESHSLAKKIPSPHPMQAIIKQKQERSKRFGSFFKLPVIGDEVPQLDLEVDLRKP